MAVQGPFRILNSTLPNGLVGSGYNASLSATGGATPYQWSATGLPAGLSISGSGAITGTPTAAGTSSVAIMVTDSTNPVNLVATLTLPLLVVSPLSITTSSLPSGSVGAAYSATVAATGGTPNYTWSATGLPAGLSINATTGAITGTPTGAATSTVAITVADSSAPSFSATRNLSLSVVSGLVITTSTLPNGTVGSVYSAAVAAAGGTTSYSFSATGLPAGLSVSAAGQITGTPTANGTSTVNFTVTDSSSPQLTATKSISITIGAGLAITTESLPNGVMNANYNAPLSATGGTPGYNWSASGLPAGLVINSGTGQITGVPTAAGSSTVNVTVTDSGSPQLTASKSFPVTISAGLAITTTSLPTGVVNSAYTATLAASGGSPAYTWSATGIPTGLSLNTSTGVISGTPTIAATSTIGVTVTDTTSQTMTINLTLVIGPTVSITTSSLPGGVANASYNTTLAASGGTPAYTWAATGLPAGLSLNTSSGVISGTPTANGTFPVNITVTDSASRTASTTLSLVIGPGLSITTTALPGGSVSAAYSFQLAATGGSPSYTWSATGLPSGLSINLIGVIAGTPTAVGTSPVAITVTDQIGRTATANLSLVVVSGVTVSTTSLPNGQVNVFYLGHVDATGGTPPYSWTASGFPAGLGFNGSIGDLGGTVTVAGTSNVVFTVTDSTGGTATKTLSLTIAGPPVGINTTSLPNGAVGTAYSATLVGSGGSTPYFWSATGLPAGLGIGINSGVISGTPTASGTSTVVIVLAGTTGGTATKSLSLTIGTGGGGGGQIGITGATVGKDLQTNITITLPSAAASDTIVQLSSDNPNVLLGSTGRNAIQVTILAGQTSVPVFVQGTASSGSATLTATNATIGSGTGVVVLAPSGFVVEGPNGLVPPFPSTFQAFANVFTNMLVSSARLDAAGRFAEKQIIRVSFGTTTIPVPLSATAGVLSASSVNFTSGDSAIAFTYRNTSPGTATISAAAPSGYTAVTDSSNSVVATIQNSGLIPDNVTVGRSLAAVARVALNGVAPSSGLAITVSTNDNTRFKLSTSPTAAGQDSITLNLPANARISPDFYVYGLQNSGSATYQATATNFGSQTGTVTLAASGVVFATSFGQPPNPILTTPGSAPTVITVYTGILNGSGGFVPPAQPVAGGLSVTSNISVSPSSVGSVVPSAVTIAGGSLSSNVQFNPGSAGNAVISLSTPAGFSTPASNYSQIAVTNRTAGINCTDGVLIGKDLQVQGNCTLGVPTTSSTTFTFTGSARLQFSQTATASGQATLTITVPAGTSNIAYFLQSFDSTGSASYMVSAPGYQNAAPNAISLIPSGLVVGNIVDLPFTNVLAGSTTTLNVYSVASDPSTHAFVEKQSLRGGLNVTASLTSGNSALATVPSTVVIPSGRDVNTPVTVTLTGVSAGATSVSVSNANFTSVGQSGFNLASTMSVNVQ